MPKALRLFHTYHSSLCLFGSNRGARVLVWQLQPTATGDGCLLRVCFLVKQFAFD